MTFSRRAFLSWLAALPVARLTLCRSCLVWATEKTEDLTQYVRPEIGTGGYGHTFPAATVPFGAVQLGPDTGDYNWSHCSGYHYNDFEILGFSHTHLSGTGVGDMLDFRVMPGMRRPDAIGKRPHFTAKFSHHDEHSEPGYYSVRLQESGIQAELTATERAGFHRYTFPGDGGCLMVDLEPVWRLAEESPGEPTLVLWAKLALGRDSLQAARSTDAWAKGREIYCSMKFSRPFKRVEIYQDGKMLQDSAGLIVSKKLMCILYFDTKPGEQILVKSGISGVDGAGAERNLEAEISAWNFDSVRHNARAKWQSALTRAVVTSSNLRNKQIFYTSLYHMMLAPSLFDDVDGRYRGMDGKVHVLKPGVHNYSTFSLWDTYRALHPMFTLILSERVPDLVNCIVRQSSESPQGVTVWPLQGKETGCMVGYHSAPVVAEALVKGLSGIDAKAAFRAFHKRAEEDEYRGLGDYRKYGYVPCDFHEESVSKTMDYAYDDWCVAAIAEAAGEHEEALRLRRRSRFYRNLYDHDLGFIRPRYADGHWAEPFDPKSITITKKWRDYTEANAWQTTFLVQHDGDGLCELLGGKAALEKKLDGLFHQSSDLPSEMMPPDVTGMVGQYCHGNEPSHHIAFYYNVAGTPNKTQSRIRQLMADMYDNKPDGMAGNEDCGQMSAWYCMNALGFYPVDPVSGKYDIGIPLFEKLKISIGDKRTLSIETRRESPRSIYVKAVTLNGKKQSGWKLAHKDLVQGGTLLFELIDAIPA